jgi:NADH dehydrogenase
LLADVTGFDTSNRRVIYRTGERAYDTLIVAAGMADSYFGHQAWEKLAPGLKSIEDATTVRARVLYAFEAAERETDPREVQKWLTFVIVGGGATGVELAGALAEIARYTLRGNFQHIDPARAKILLIEGATRVLPPYPQELSTEAAKSLSEMGITVMTGCLVNEVQPDFVVVECSGKSETIETHTVLWAAGVQGSPLGKALAAATGADVDKAGRVKVQPDLTVPGHPEIFVIGDLAYLTDQTGNPLPGVAQVAMQQGRYVAHLIEARLKSKRLPPFHYRDRGKMATIGRASAVADLGRIKLHGYIGWLAWLFIHLIYLIEFENRVLVLFQWAWNYFTRNRAARLITWESRLEPAVKAPTERDIEMTK